MNTTNDGLDLSRLETQSQEPETPPLTRSGPRRWHILRVLVLLAVIAAGALAWMSAHHIIQTDNGVAVIRKRYFSLEHNLVDIRNWDYQAFQANQELTKAMILQGYGDMVKLPPPTATERIALRFRRHLREITGSVETGLQHAGETTRDWTVYIFGYWRNKFNG